MYSTNGHASVPKLLTDEQMRHFIVNGFVNVKTDLPTELHETIYNRTNDLFGDAENVIGPQNPLNNILPMVPELQQVLDAPAVTGALTSLLGNNYVLHPHRHCHPNFPTEPKDEGQGLLMGIHKDGHAGGKRPRHRVPRWLIMFYFPQDCPVEQGPTCVIPGNQYLRNHLTTSEPMNTQAIIPAVREDGTRGLPDNFYNQTLMPCAGELGTVWFLHFDIEHSVFFNFANRARYGMKFVFMRTEEPTAPTWDNHATYWQMPQTSYVPHDQEAVWTYTWNWFRGNSDRFANEHVSQLDDVDTVDAALTADDPMLRQHAVNTLGLQRNADAIPTLVKAMDDEHEPVRLNAAFSLAAIGEPAVEPLVNALDAGKDAFEKEPILFISDAAYALAAMGKPAVPALKALLTDDRDHMRTAAIFALGDMGPLASDATETLVSMLDEPNILIQRHIITAIGLTKGATNAAVPALADMLEHPEPEVTHITAQALTRIGSDAAPAVPALTKALYARGAYVRGWSTEALTRIGTPDALRGLTHFIQAARWFPYVHQRNVYFSVDTNEKPVDRDNPADGLAAILKEWVSARGMVPDKIDVTPEAGEENTYKLDLAPGRSVFAEIAGEKIEYFDYRRGEEGVGIYR
ncbi:MAG: HEAT repeat domain-containing protein [Chloroflexota bacterium]